MHSITKEIKPMPTAAVELDCRGLDCPLPVLQTRKALTELPEGRLLRVVCTDPMSVVDLGAFSHTSGHPIVEQSEAAGEFIFLFRKA